MAARRLWIIVAFMGIATLACAQLPQNTQSGDGLGQPKQGGIIKVRVPNDPYDWDTSYVGKSPPNHSGMNLGYDSLLSYESGPTIGHHERILTPKLAERWEASSDAKTFTFHLRKGVNFASSPPVNGRPLTANDAKWSLEYQARAGEFANKKLPQGQFEWMLEGLDRIEVTDPQTAVIRFKQPLVPFISYAGADMLPIMPKEIYETEGHLKNTIVGSGPYQLDRASSQVGTRWIWQKNQHYWEAGKPYLDAVHWLVIPEDATAHAAFKAGQLDLIGGAPTITFNNAQEIQKLNPNAVMLETQGVFGDFWLRVAAAPLNDVRVRRAIALSIDRDELMRVFQGGRGRWQMPHLLTDYFSQEEIKGFQPYNPAEARRLLGEAGYPNGLDLEMTYPGKQYGEQYITHLELLQSQLKKGGINLLLKVIDAQAYSTNRKQGEFTINLLTGSDARWDVDGTLYKFHPESKSNYAGTVDPELKRLIEAQRAEVDPTKRKDLIRQAGRIIAEKAYGIVMYTPVSFEFWQPYVKNYTPNWNVEGWPLLDTWLDK